MYWVFEKDQLDKAKREWLKQNTTATPEMKAAFNAMLNDFLTSDAARESKMLRGENQ